jgi:hypothetical protein
MKYYVVYQKHNGLVCYSVRSDLESPWKILAKENIRDIHGTRVQKQMLPQFNVQFRCHVEGQRIALTSSNNPNQSI